MPFPLLSFPNSPDSFSFSRFRYTIILELLSYLREDVVDVLAEEVLFHVVVHVHHQVIELHDEDDRQRVENLV
jgi:hypothetical protein